MKRGEGKKERIRKQENEVVVEDLTRLGISVCRRHAKTWRSRVTFVASHTRI